MVPASAHGQAFKTDRPQLPADSLVIARKYTQWFLTSMADSLWAHQDAEGRKAQPVERIQAMIENFATRAGNETGTATEKWMVRKNKTQYMYQNTFSSAPEPVVLRWVLDEKGNILGMGLGLLSQVPPADAPPAAK